MNNFLEWNKLLCSNERDSKNIGIETSKDLRSQYTRDVDRITFYADFRRLSHKTQVFSFPSNNIIHNRLTHSLEVASIAKNLAERVALYIYDNHGANINMDKHDFSHALMQISQAASLIHDIGNPPFGHSGEDSIKEAFASIVDKYKDVIPSNLGSTIQDLKNFEGNAYGLHLLLTRKNLNLTYATIATMIKYPICTNDWQENKKDIKKNGIFNYDLPRVDTILRELGLKKEDKFCRHPLSYIMEAADDIAYAICDLEDAFRLGIINEKSELNGHLFSIKDILLQLINVEKFEKFTDNFSYIRSKAISKLSDIAKDKFVENYDAIMNGTFEEDLLSGNSHLDYIKKFSAQSIYKTSAGLFLESASFNIINTLLSKFLTAYIEIYFKNNCKNSYKNILKLLEQESDTYRLASLNTENHSEKLFAIIGFIVRMSDNYAMDFYNRITGITTKGIE